MYGCTYVRTYVCLDVFMSACMFPHSFTKNFDDPIAILFYEGIEILLVREGTFSVLRYYSSLAITFGMLRKVLKSYEVDFLQV